MTTEKLAACRARIRFSVKCGRSAKIIGRSGATVGDGSPPVARRDAVVPPFGATGVGNRLSDRCRWQFRVITAVGVGIGTAMEVKDAIRPNGSRCPKGLKWEQQAAVNCGTGVHRRQSA